MSLSYPFIILSAVCFTLSVGAYSPTLRHVNLLYRHGDRSPVVIYPHDINTEKDWPDGLGWLTNIGKEQQYELGQYLRQRYGGFINVTRYQHEQLIVQASAVPRCLMSAYSNLAGFFPPQGEEVWNANIPWQPIPVSSVPENLDSKLAMSKPCPRYSQLYDEMFHSKAVQDYQQKNKAFFKMVSNHTGMVETVENIWKVSDALLCEKAHNMTWNSWVNDKIYAKLREITDFGWVEIYGTPEMAKLKGGPLLKEMIQNMKIAATDASVKVKMHMYSAHDSTVAAVMSAMKVFNDLHPPYRTLVMVELHKIDNADVVKVFYRNETTKDPFSVSPPGCENPCKLSTFETVLHNTIPQDWDAECQTVSKAPLDLSPASWVALALGLCLVGMLVIGLFILVRQKKHRYTRV